MDRPAKRRGRGHPIPAELRAQILESLQAGGTREGIARQHGVSHTTVRNIARAAGMPIGSVPAALRTATEVHVLDARNRRAQLRSDALVEASRVLAQFRAPATTWVFDTKEGEFKSNELPEPDTKSLRDLAITFGILTDKVLELDRYDAEGSTATRGALLELYAKLEKEEAAAAG